MTQTTQLQLAILRFGPLAMSFCCIQLHLTSVTCGPVAILCTAFSYKWLPLDFLVSHCLFTKLAS